MSTSDDTKSGDPFIASNGVEVTDGFDDVRGPTGFSAQDAHAEPATEGAALFAGVGTAVRLERLQLEIMTLTGARVTDAMREAERRAYIFEQEAARAGRHRPNPAEAAMESVLEDTRAGRAWS